MGLYELKCCHKNQCDFRLKENLTTPNGLSSGSLFVYIIFIWEEKLLRLRSSGKEVGGFVDGFKFKSSWDGQMYVYQKRKFTLVQKFEV